MRYDMGLAKKLIFKIDTILTVYRANINRTHPPPITSAIVSTPMRLVVRRRQPCRVYPETQDSSQFQSHTLMWWKRTVQLWHHDCQSNLQDGSSAYSLAGPEPWPNTGFISQRPFSWRSCNILLFWHKQATSTIKKINCPRPLRNYSLCLLEVDLALFRMTF